uniref:Uncharacterized protein n=1 Tax=Meloidogyne javanica TaxID=6303 RepID=A0A915LBH7_MELJA
MAKLLTDEAFQKLLFDLLCVWHDVQRHYDPPITHTEEEKMQKVKQLICKLLGEIDGRVKRIQTMLSTTPDAEQEFIEEWSLLTWNVLCITSRLQNELNVSVKSQEDKVIFNKLNMALVDLVNNSRAALNPLSVHIDATFDLLANSLSETMHILHGLYRTLKSNRQMNSDEVQDFAQRFDIVYLVFSLVNKVTLPVEPVVRLVSFYSFQMHRLAILAARLQGFRYELTVNHRQMFGDYDPVRPLSDSVFSALELLMADCVLATEPSMNPILVTNNLFSIYCGALARGVVFKQFNVQIVSEDTAEHIQSEMRRQRLLQQPSPIAQVPSAALLAMKPTINTIDTSGNTTTAHKKSDINSKEVVTIYPAFNTKNRYWAAIYPHLLCTTRQKGRHSTNNSYQDLSPSGVDPTKLISGKRPIFYFYIRATMFSPSGRFADAHTLSLPFTIATRRNQYKIQCNDCSPPSNIQGIGDERKITFKNILCPHLRYECGSTNVRFSVWRGLLELLQLFQDNKTCVKKLWEKNLLMGFMEFDQVAKLLSPYPSALIMRLSFVTGGTICITLKSTVHQHSSGIDSILTDEQTSSTSYVEPMHLEPLDLKKLQAKSLVEYLRDIALTEKIKYLINANGEPLQIGELLLEQFNEKSAGGVGELETSRCISSNVTHCGDV